MDFKTLGTYALVVGTALLGFGGIFYALNQPMELSFNHYFLSGMGNIQAQEMVRKKETRDRNRPWAIKAMIAGGIVSVIGVGILLSAKSEPKK
jgi:hypothetical protein